MTTFNQIRLTNDTFRFDMEGMRRGIYSDKYFENIRHLLATLAEQGYTYKGHHPSLRGVALDAAVVGDIEVEVQLFTRRPGKTVAVGVDAALAMLRECTGYFDENGTFVNTWNNLAVEAVHDGDWLHYAGDPLHVQPVIRVRGRYRDFALLETAMLGILTRASRIATNVYDTLVAARGKPVLFFPARFDLHQTQATDGYAYHLAIERYNHDHSYDDVGAFISTDAQGMWWGGVGGGTIAHAVIASFFGDTAETMMQFAATIDPATPRIALVDFNNDSLTDTRRTMLRMFSAYRQLMDVGEVEEARRYVLYGVRLDTSGSMRDASVPPLGDRRLDMGVNPRLVFFTREAIDTAWQHWDLPAEWHTRAADWCHNVRIVVTGGFNVDKITRFEQAGAPVDIYGVGSGLLANRGETDFTADVVRTRVGDTWQTVAKVGRAPGDHPALQPVN